MQEKPCREGGSSWVLVALAEYQAQRAEVLAAIQARQQTLTFGAAALSILVAGAFHVWDNRLLAAIAFLIVIPIVSVAVLIQWAGQVIALERNGAYLGGLEKAIRGAYGAVPNPVLTWEARQSAPTGPKPDYRWHEVAAFVVFGLFAGGSVALGAYRASHHHSGLVFSVTAVMGLIVAATLVWLGAELLGIGATREAFEREFAEPSSLSAEATRVGPAR